MISKNVMTISGIMVVVLVVVVVVIWKGCDFVFFFGAKAELGARFFFPVEKRQQQQQVRGFLLLRIS